MARVAMLPVSGRATIVLELSAPLAKVEHTQADATSVVIEGGPVLPGFQARLLEPLGASPIVRRVALSPSARPDGVTYFRLHITSSAPVSHQLRTAGTRLYVDLVPSDIATAGSRPSTEPTAEAEPDQTVRRPTQPLAPLSNEEAAAAYRELESSVMAKARGLAQEPDVKSLLRLREDVQKRDAALGKRQPDLVSRLLDELTRLTDEARARQLERDRGTFVKKP